MQCYICNVICITLYVQRYMCDVICVTSYVQRHICNVICAMLYVQRYSTCMFIKSNYASTTLFDIDQYKDQYIFERVL